MNDLTGFNHGTNYKEFFEAQTKIYYNAISNKWNKLAHQPSEESTELRDFLNSRIDNMGNIADELQKSFERNEVRNWFDLIIARGSIGQVAAKIARRDRKNIQLLVRSNEWEYTFNKRDFTVSRRLRQLAKFLAQYKFTIQFLETTTYQWYFFIEIYAVLKRIGYVPLNIFVLAEKHVVYHPTPKTNDEMNEKSHIDDTITSDFDLKWTGRNIDAIKIVYALFESRMLNDGRGEITKIIPYLGQIFKRSMGKSWQTNHTKHKTSRNADYDRLELFDNLKHHYNKYLEKDKK